MKISQVRYGLLSGAFVLSLVAAGCAGEPSPDLAGEEGEGAEQQALNVSLSHFQAESGRLGFEQLQEQVVFRSARVEEDGSAHVRFQQTYRGVKVFEGEAISHVARDGAVTLTDALRRDVSVDVEPSLDKELALDLALEHLDRDGTIEVSIEELVVLPRGDRSATDRLTWHFKVFAEDDELGPAQRDTFVDAHTGEVVWSFDSLETSASVGTGKTMHSGDTSISTDSTAGTYYLRDLTRGAGNYTCNMKNRSVATCSQTSFASATNVFGNNDLANTDAATAAADAHFGMQTTWDFFLNTFGRNGINGAGKNTYSRVHYSKNYVNAFWSDSCHCMTYGDGGGSYHALVTLDIAGHEMAHGVMASEAALTYSGESGGLNESSSDIFGTLVEQSANNAVDPGDWLVGERIYKSNFSGGVFTPNVALRYMTQPSLDGISPNCWSAGLGSIDVHYSSGPNNHMFYLLSSGGTSACNGNSVSGIGTAKAGQIWYRAIANYMTASTKYAGARAACISAATDLYGAASAEVAAVKAAYSAINVN